MLKFDYKLRVNQSVRAKCERHSAYDPSTTGKDHISDAIGSLLRKGLWRSHSEPGRQQGRVWAHSDRERVAHCQRGGWAHPGQANGNAQRPRRPG